LINSSLKGNIDNTGALSNAHKKPGKYIRTRVIKDMNERQSKRNATSVGEDGSAVQTHEWEQPAVEKGWRSASFNEYVSDKISLERRLIDTRKPECRQKTYDYDTLPVASVIICFTEESLSTLLRSVHSVLNRTPPELLEEILLVDDFSKRDYLDEELDAYLKKYPKVKIIRLMTRHGLVRARLVAVEQAKASVLVFLDSHIECNVGWLEPLLDVIVSSLGKAVVSPIIDVIDPRTFKYQQSPDNMRGAFTWSLEFRWKPIPAYESARRTDLTDTIRTPAMAGGLFAIDKRFFNDIGR